MKLFSGFRTSRAAQSQPDTKLVRVEMAPNMGDTVNCLGDVYTAKDGVLEVPAHVAEVLKGSHIPDVKGALPAEVNEVAKRISELQGQRRAEGERVIALHGAMRAADKQFGVDDTDIVAPRNLGEVLADQLMGKATKADVDAAQRATNEFELKQRAQGVARERAKAARTELQDRINAIEHGVVAPLDAEIRRLSIWAVRLSAEAAGRRMRDAFDAAARAFADVQAHAEVLKPTDQKFLAAGVLHVELPVFRGLEAFGDLPPGPGPMALHIAPLMPDAHDQIHKSLAAAGITV